MVYDAVKGVRRIGRIEWEIGASASLRVYFNDLYSGFHAITPSGILKRENVWKLYSLSFVFFGTW